MRKMLAVWIALHLAASLAPLAKTGGAPKNTRAAFTAWPATFEGRKLTRLPLTELERRYHKNFPGHIARFTDGDREIVMRWLKKGTRRLHPISDCLRGSGYDVKPLPIRIDTGGRQWSCVSAKREGTSMRACEIIFDEAGSSWSDVSSWYWASVLRETEGPFWAVTAASETEEK
jgi:hypothetical protein